MLKLNDRQRRTLKRLAVAPVYKGSTNPTMLALQRRGLAEPVRDAGPGVYLAWRITDLGRWIANG